jgi:multimeric flavodoxin WrbA
MRVLAIDCSARADGLTARMSRAACDGAAQVGAQIEWVSLQDCKIERCRMCDPNGWGDCRRLGTCIIADDLAKLVEKLGAADRLIFATPVYFGDLSESAKAFTDRLRRTSTFPGRRQFLRNVPTLAIAVAGGGGGGIPTCLMNIERALSVPGCFLVDMVGVARRNAGYKIETLRLAGQALAGPPHETWPGRNAAGDR